MVTVKPEDPSSADVQQLLSAFVQDVRKRYKEPPADVGEFDPALVAGPRSCFLVARRDGQAVGCGALVPMEDDRVEIKRVYVVPSERSRGIATRVVEELVQKARSFGYTTMRLETGDHQPESIALYGKAGFYRIPNFPPYETVPEAVCFERKI